MTFLFALSYLAAFLACSIYIPKVYDLLNRYLRVESRIGFGFLSVVPVINMGVALVATSVFIGLSVYREK